MLVMLSQAPAASAGGGGAISISSVSGTQTHGSTLTINGTGFGSHADYGGAEAFLCRAWNDFTSSRYTGGWESDGLLNVEANLALTTTGALGGACTQFIRKQNVNDSGSEQQGCVTTFNVGDPQVYYCSFWYRQSPSAIGGTGTKMCRFYYADDSTSTPGLAANIYFGPDFQNATDHNEDETQFNIHHFSGTSAHGGTSNYISLINNAWVFNEFTIYKSGGTANFGSADYVEWYCTIPGQGTPRQRMFRRGSDLASNPVPNEGTNANENHTWVDNGTLTDDSHTQGDLGNHMNESEDAGAYMDFHDAYMSYTIARVMFGNASTFAACDEFHMQIPTAWSDTQIQVTLNRGQWANFTGIYAYVINADNEVSAGFAL